MQANIVNVAPLAPDNPSLHPRNVRGQIVLPSTISPLSLARPEGTHRNQRPPEAGQRSRLRLDLCPRLASNRDHDAHLPVGVHDLRTLLAVLKTSPRGRSPARSPSATSGAKSDEDERVVRADVDESQGGSLGGREESLRLVDRDDDLGVGDDACALRNALAEHLLKLLIVVPGPLVAEEGTAALLIDVRYSKK